jgi:pyruvate dehydrogenase E2 component (dihydrolipoamide acetyltransferase)
MATAIIMPKVDMVMETGTFVEWLKKEGQQVEKGESIFVMMTDKSAIEVEAPASGILAGLTAKPDDVLPVTTVVGYILKPGESLPAGTVAPTVAAAAPAVEAAKPGLAAVAATVAASAPISAAQPVVSAEDLRATPVARKMAKDLGVDLTLIPGSGPRGRIYRADLERYLASGKPASAPAAAAPKTAAPVALPASEVPLPNARVLARQTLKGPRAIIAQRMAYSASTIPHIYETITVDMTELVRLRERILPVVQEQTGQKISYTAILAYIVARELVKFPYMNSSLAGTEVIQWQDVHLGIATSLEDYLIVPVVREAQSKDLKSIVVEMARLLEKARGRKLEPAEMSGGTFTISNLGMFGIEQFTAIINPPEAAILAVGKMADSPVVVNGQVEVRPLMKLTLAADHRIIDGAAVARFLSSLKATMENPYLLI